MSITKIKEKSNTISAAERTKYKNPLAIGRQSTYICISDKIRTAVKRFWEIVYPSTD